LTQKQLIKHQQISFEYQETKRKAIKAELQQISKKKREQEFIDSQISIIDTNQKLNLYENQKLNERLVEGLEKKDRGDMYIWKSSTIFENTVQSCVST